MTNDPNITTTEDNPSGSDYKHPFSGQPTRRDAIKTVLLGATTLAASSAFGAETPPAQKNVSTLQKMELTNKTAFITGGARGIGLETANEPNPTFPGISEMLKPGNPIPIGHLEPLDIARAVMFFAGDATAKVTGEVFDISYGSLARSIA